VEGSPEAKDPDFDDSGWDVVDPGFGWDRSEGERWFRKTVTVPEDLFGLSLKGVRVDYRVTALTELELFLDGRLVDRSGYWFDGMFPLTEGAQPPEEHLIAVHIPRGESRGNFNGARWFIEPIEEMLLDIGITDARLQLIDRLASLDLMDFGEDVNADIEVPPTDEIADVAEVCRELDRSIRPQAEKLEGLNSFLVGHAHIDMNWLWDFEDTIDICRRTFRSVDALMDEFPSFVFSQSQAAVYALMKEHEPELFERIKRRVEEGRWDVTASTWVEGDLNMASGESLIRQTTCALDFVERELGVSPKVCWCPDTFGHSWTYPQILAKCGIEYYYAHRCTRREAEHLFRWESPDGSRVLVFNEGVTYNNQITPDLALSIPKMMNNFGCPSHLVVFGVGDHGGGPTRHDLRNLDTIVAQRGFPRYRNSRAEEFFSSVESADVPVVSEELNFVFEGCYTTHADIKLMNRRGEAMLFTSEVLASLAASEGLDYPRGELEEAWHNVLFNQFHDLLDGSAISEAYRYSRRIFERSRGIWEDIQRRSMRALLGPEEENSLCIFNPLGWDRKERIGFDAPNGDFTLLDLDRDEEIPVQVEGDAAIFTAEVPSLGHSTYRVVPGKPSYGSGDGDDVSALPGQNGEPHILENRFFKVSIDPENGTLTSIYDKRLERELVAPKGRANLFQVCFEVPHGMSAWRIGDISRVENLLSGAEAEVLRSGPVEASVRVKHRFSSSQIEQEIVLYRDLPRIDFLTDIDWQEVGGPDIDSPMLKVSFPWAHSSGRCIREIPFGHISSPTDGREIPSLTFLELPGDGFGVALLNDSKYGHDARGNTVRLTLLRAAYDPDPKPDIGRHRLAYSIFPHAGEWGQAEVWKAGHQLNHPCLILKASPPKHRRSWLSVDSPGIDVSAVKGAEDGQGMIVRLVEMLGRKVDVEIEAGWKTSKVTRCDPRERPVSEVIHLVSGKTTVTANPHEIVTLRFE